MELNFYDIIRVQGTCAPENVRAAMEWSRNWLRGILSKTFLEYLLQSYKIRKVYDPFIRAAPEEIFPNIRAVASAVPAAWLLLRPGERLSIQSLDPSYVPRLFARIMALTYPDWVTIRHLRALRGVSVGHAWSRLIYDNMVIPGLDVLYDVPGLSTTYPTATIPSGIDPKKLHSEFLAQRQETLNAYGSPGNPLVD